MGGGGGQDMDRQGYGQTSRGGARERGGWLGGGGDDERRVTEGVERGGFRCTCFKFCMARPCMHMQTSIQEFSQNRFARNIDLNSGKLSSI